MNRMEPPAKRRDCVALVVDDSHDAARKVVRFLRKIGIDAVTSGSGKHALERLRQGERFALVVSDLEMPEMGGVAFHEAARAVWPEIDTVIIYVSDDGAAPAMPDAPSFTKSLDSAFHAYVQGVLAAWCA